MDNMISIREIVQYLESVGPPALQDTSDNSGLLCGNPAALVSSALVTIDVTEDIIDEAIHKNAGLVVAHHPLIYRGLKRLTGSDYVERTVIKAVKNDIAIFAGHTNFDHVWGGVNSMIARKLGLQKLKVLRPLPGQLKKLVTFIPYDASEKVKEAVFHSGAGHIGNYDWCGYSLEGTGSFRGSEDTNPYVGEKGKVHEENEIRFETIFPAWLQSKVVGALLASHPYEEVAYDIYPLDNEYGNAGMGMAGELPVPADEMEFLSELKDIFGSGIIRHSALRGKKVSKVAVCGGVGSYLTRDAISAGADFFVSSDFKYHQFFDAEGKIVLADIGHFESEQFTKELFYELLVKKFPTFAVHFSEVNTNPVFYF
jgi:dinuclear metal center YbgI/SA1388 family protein